MNIEDRRQLEHLLPFAFSFLLPYLSFWQAVAFALAGLGYALFVSFYFATTRQSERVSRWTSGKVIYALSVLLAILIFFPATGVIAAGWAALAVGDSFSNLVGRRWGAVRLPWNSSKSWVGLSGFIVTSVPAAWLAMLWHQTENGVERWTLFLFVAAAMFAAALLESLPAVINDNFTVTLGSAAVLALLLSSQPLTVAWTYSGQIALPVSAAFALAALLLRLVRWSGALAGAVVGALVLGSIGAAGFAQLLAFFVLGTTATYWGFRSKQRRGIAQAHGGRRGAVNTLANCAAAALLSLAYLIDGPGRVWLAIGFSAALATATFDTVATELGQLYGKITRNPWTWKPVPAGTEGAISLQGTLLGAAAAGLILLLPTSTGWLDFPTMLVCWAAALAAGMIESLLAARTPRLPELKTPARGHWMNFFSTLIAAALAMAYWIWGRA